jgi:nucleotide-binding universal stress UspA family protein
MACSLARDYRARLVVLQIAEPPPSVTHAELERVLQHPDDYRRKLEEKLRQIYPSDSPGNVEYRIQDGHSATEILGLAREAQCDLIVMGMHGRTGLERLR